MDFDKRLERAIGRGRFEKDTRQQAAAEQAVNEEDLRNAHAGARLELSERIETCLKKLSDHFPGFSYETIVNEEGWGAKIRRDDLQFSSGTRRQAYSQLEMLIGPFNSTHIIELTTKGTVRNREVLNRRHFQQLTELDTTSFSELIDLWVLEYAEKYASND